ncbi:MAG TPA: YHYH protein [Roseimicrobium sp.]|nr:YHYH protein [Roseimicrobium sp.]
MSKTTLFRPAPLLLGIALAVPLSLPAHPGHDEVLIVAALAPDTVLAQTGGPGQQRGPGGPGGGPQQSTSGNTTYTNSVQITVEGDFRVVRANGIPDHPTGQFPGRGNPNRIGPQRYEFRMPAKPQAAAQATALRMQPFGVAVNGVVFDPGAAEWWRNDRSSTWQYEPMSGAINLGVDQSNAHVQPNGSYHYHAIPLGLVSRLTGNQAKMAIVGWAADGFPIYGPWAYSDAKNTNSALKKVKSSYRVRSGERPDGPGGKYDGSFVADYEYAKDSGDLDECNGRFGITPEFPKGTYYYVLTEAYPYIPRAYRGTPDRSFQTHGGPGGPGGRGGPGGGPGGPGGGRGPGGGGPGGGGFGPPEGRPPGF